ncbi:K02A2.6-like [Cordylochernes scorpioides]|uniref:RNA-directed DNA polymerase n=1 Tax=Cordylochernes scorpioides TaxID=51811 RepID=A0ABY6LTI8_9ARAC|nr:K02A2.6-like [Cordylochernes scorpioides]
MDGECLLWGMRVIIPSSLRKNMLSCLHETHSRMSKMKAVARSHFWWPNLDNQIECMVLCLSLGNAVQAMIIMVVVIIIVVVLNIYNSHYFLLFIRPSKPAPSRVSKPAAAQVILHGEKSAAHTVVISDDPQADPRELLKAVRAAHTLPQGVWASLHTKGKLVLHSSNPDTIPEVTTSLASKLNGMKVRQQKEILPRICLFKVDEETSNSTIEETFLETAAIRKLPGDKVVRVAHRSTPRSGTCTAFIEVDLKTFRALGVRGRIVVDGVILNFEESIRARVCFRCCGFGHNSAQCSRAPKCFHCGQDGHEGRACPSIADQRTSKCANCCSKGLPDKHEARASSCPILKSSALKF